MKKSWLAFSILTVLCSGTFIIIAPAQQNSATPSAQATAATAKPIEQMVSMRDWVNLSTAIYLPQGTGPFPVVLIRTPYGKGTQTINHATWTGRGFALVS